MRNSKFELVFEDQAQKFLRKLDRNAQGRILAAALLLRIEPRPPKSKKVKGFDYFRIRVGDYRLIYEIHENKLVVVVVTIGHRKNVYDKLNKLKP